MSSSTVQVPSLGVSYVPLKGGEEISLGPLNMRIIEDGSNTSDRIGIAEFVLPPKASGPPMHWHEMHDECFYTSKGTIRYHVPGKPDIDAKTGEWTVIPIRAPHTFSNPFDEEARFINTYTPAYYINYFRLLANIVKEKGTMTADDNRKAMTHFATIPVPKEYLEKALNENLP